MSLPFEYGRGVRGDDPDSIRRLADVLSTDLHAMGNKWGIDEMTVPEWSHVDGTVQIRFRYASAGYAASLGPK